MLRKFCKAAEHQKIADYLKECAFEKVWLVGDQFAAAEHSFQTYVDDQCVIVRFL